MRFRSILSIVVALTVINRGVSFAAEPEARSTERGGMRVQLPDGERGKVLRVNEQTLVIQPLPRQRMVRTERPAPGVGNTAPRGSATAPSPEEEAAAEAEAPAEK